MRQELIPRTTITELCAHRDAALLQMQEGALALQAAYKTVDEAYDRGKLACGAQFFHLPDENAESACKRLWPYFDARESVEAYRRKLDASVWKHLILLTGMSQLMDKTEKEKMEKKLAGENVPEVSEEAAREIFRALMGDARLIFQRGLARAFSELDRRFKSHDAFKIGSRIILTHVYDATGYSNFHTKQFDTIQDIERVFAVLGKKKPDLGALRNAIQADRPGYGPRRSVTETRYFKIKIYKNGNAHLWMLRDDLVELANKELAAYYGEVLPDAATPEDTVDDLRTVSGLPSVNLSFYPTPAKVIKAILRDVHITSEHTVLEPSAGTGNITRELLKLEATVHAVEIHPDRARSLKRIRHRRLKVYRANFLTLTLPCGYDRVVMNPPFYGTHWMQHVLRAFDLLKPGGILIAVLPISAALGTTKAHVIFQKWAAENTTRWNKKPDFQDLPAESFAESGTRVSTTILKVQKKK